MKKIILMAIAFCSFAMVSAQSASEVTAKYNDAVAAYQAKNWSAALEGFEAVVKGGQDSEDGNVLSLVATSKKSIPTCYRMLGTRAAGAKKWDEAVKYLTASAEKAELWGDNTAKLKSNQILAKVYQAQGGEAFNAGDYAAAVTVFEKGYAANSRNTGMALFLAESYFKSDMYQDGMKICTKIAAMNPDKFAEAIASAQYKMEIYTNNQVAKLQMANDYDGIIAMASELEDTAMAAKITLQAYYGKKDFNKMIELSESALAVQTTDEGRSDIYYLLGVAYNEKEQFDQAIAAMKNVTAGNNVANAQAVITALTATE